MNTLSMLIIAMLYQEYGELWEQLERLEVLHQQYQVIIDDYQPYSGVTDRGLMIEGQLYCTRIVIPDGTHTMPIAASDGPTVPMPTWPGDLMEADG